MTEKDRSWHGQFDLPNGRSGRWQIGPLTLWIQHLEGEWRIARETGEDAMDLRSAVEIPVEADLLEREVVDRHGVMAGGDSVELIPALADRPVVARPEKPFHLPRGEQAVVFVGSPLWVKIQLSGSRLSLLDVPIFRPSDTWFGPSTMVGELCYASRTYLKLNRESVQRYPHRALSLVKIVNRSETPLTIESLKLPVPQLMLYQGEDGQIWTQDVTFEREKDRNVAALRIRKRAPSLAKNAVPIGESRDAAEENVMMRAFNAIFSSTGLAG